MKTEVEIHAKRFVKRLDVYVVWFVCSITCKFWFDDIFHFVSVLTVLQHESKVQGYSLQEYAFDATTKLYSLYYYHLYKFYVFFFGANTSHEKAKQIVIFVFYLHKRPQKFSFFAKVYEFWLRFHERQKQFLYKT